MSLSHPTMTSNVSIKPNLIHWETRAFTTPKVIDHLLPPHPPGKCYRNTGSILIYTILTLSFTKIRLARANSSVSHVACGRAHVRVSVAFKLKCMNIHLWASFFLWLSNFRIAISIGGKRDKDKIETQTEKPESSGRQISFTRNTMQKQHRSAGEEW